VTIAVLKLNGMDGHMGGFAVPVMQQICKKKRKMKL
jgi:hypothetical protein